jgi:hypothetical protein
VRSRLWTRYTVRSDGASAVIHTAEANDSEPIALSDEAVLAAIAYGRLTFDVAVERGLLRFANDQGDQTRLILRAALDGDQGLEQRSDR